MSCLEFIYTCVRFSFNVKTTITLSLPPHIFQHAIKNKMPSVKQPPLIIYNSRRDEYLHDLIIQCSANTIHKVPESLPSE